MRRRIKLLIFTLIASVSAFAQQAGTEPEMADTMRQSGKIYIVVAVLGVVMAGVIIYLISIDRKVSKLENKK